jgi:hypothetical protein
VITRSGPAPRCRSRTSNHTRLTRRSKRAADEFSRSFILNNARAANLPLPPPRASVGGKGRFLSQVSQAVRKNQSRSDSPTRDLIFRK